MERQLQVFFSNRTECLYSKLKETLFLSGQSPFTKRLVVVPSPAMKAWLMMRLADDPEIGIAAGIKISTLETSLYEIIETLSVKPEDFPRYRTRLELALRVELEIRRVLQALSFLSEKEQQLWNPLFDYLQWTAKPSPKTERRLIALSDELAYLFQQYGEFGTKLLRQWKVSQEGGWQGEIWKKVVGEIFPENLRWRPSDAVIHLFALSFLSRQEHQLFMSLSQTLPVNYYLLSPCRLFWSDILSDREGRKLQALWEKQGDSESREYYLEEYLYNRNPLLANFGRMGREMAAQVEDSGAITFEEYEAPCSGVHASLLETVQGDILSLRNPCSERDPSLSNDGTLQVHVAGDPMREVQILYDIILRIIEKHAKDENPILPEDFIIMAPDIMDYAPFIRAVFDDKESQIDCQVMDLEMVSQNSLVQGFFHLISLAFGRWDAASVLKLFEFAPFQKKNGITPEDVHRIRSWIRAAEVRWGEDNAHRNELLKKHHGPCSLVDENPSGTWKHAMDRLLLGMAMASPGEEFDASEMAMLPLSILELKQGELLGKWMTLMRSLRDDLTHLSDGTQMSLQNWSVFLKSLLEAYFFVGVSEDNGENDSKELYDIITQFDVESDISNKLFSFVTIKHHLEQAAKKQRACYRESHLHAAKFCSLLPMRAVPAKVIILLGMHEGAFPHVESANSLNMLKMTAHGDYCPTQTDFDRYLFLETLLSARKYFIATYTGYSREDNKEQSPSLLVTELLSYLKKSYSIPAESIVRKHPFQAYDKSLFDDNSELRSFSKKNYRAAKAFYNKVKEEKHCFIPRFSSGKQAGIDENSLHIDLWKLNLMARNPIAAYFNFTLGMHLEKEEESVVKTDDDFLNNLLDEAILKKTAIRRPLEWVLNTAEKEGRLPVGPFKKYAMGRIREDVKEINENLMGLGIEQKNVFDVEFDSHYEKPLQLETGSWRIPPLEILFKGKPLHITGKFQEVVSQGLITYNKVDKVDAAKIWPQYLVFNCIIAKNNLPIQPGVIFAKKGGIKTPFFDDPFILLEQYLEYYFHSLQNISPLMPELVSELIEKGGEHFNKKLSTLLFGRLATSIMII